MDEVNRKLAEIVWQETGPSNVPISARRDGFLIFDFDKSPNFRQVPSTTFDEKIMRERQELAHQRFQYMNAFLMALHSGIAETMQTGTPVQSPLNPTSYCKAFEQQSLNKVWASLVHELDARNGGHTEMNRDRRRMLLEGHDYTASIVTQMLSFHKKIEDDMLARLDDARRTRNNFAHSLRPVMWDDAARAINTANELISKVVGTKVHCQTAVQWRG